MGTLKRLRCRVRGWWRSAGLGASLSGHDFAVTSMGWEGDFVVETLTCTACGTVSRGWQ